jgi:hypothetical protein
MKVEWEVKIGGLFSSEFVAQMTHFDAPAGQLSTTVLRL